MEPQGGGVGPFENWVTWGQVQNVLLEREDKAVKWGEGGSWCKNGGDSDSDPSFFCTKTEYHLYISVQKMLTALFNFVWNTQKNEWTFFFECPCKIFLNIEKVFKKLSEDQP